MSKVFNSKNLLKLESPERYVAISPIDTLTKMGLQSDDTVADIGCGTGFFALPASKIIGSNTLFAADISENMLEFIGKRATTEGVKNITTLKMNPKQIPLNDAIASFTFCAFVVHEVPNMREFIDELLRITKPGGKVVILEWKESESPFGPPLSHRISSKNLIKEIQNSSVHNINGVLIEEWFYGLIIEKKAM